MEEHILKMRTKLGQFTHFDIPHDCSRISRSNSVATEASAGTSENIPKDGIVGPTSAMPRNLTSLDSCLDNADQAIAKIRKCVSCDTNWTARKSLPQKKLHIRKCAKKNHLTSETLTILIDQELQRVRQSDFSSSHQNDKDSGTSANNIRNQAPITLLGGVVKATEAQQISRRKKNMQGSVKTVTETRPSILSKAESVLIGPLRLDVPSGSRSFSPYPATQAFKRSKIGVEAPLRLYDSHDEQNKAVIDVSELEPPSTQAFARSELISSGLNRPSLFDLEEDLDTVCRCITFVPSIQLR